MNHKINNNNIEKSKHLQYQKDHPSLDIIESYGTELVGKKVVLCVTGSVAAYKSIELARLLIRHGANVTCVISKAASKLIKTDYFKWATGNKVITELTGDLEHIRLADYNKSDLVIVYPATANTLGKLANGIDDTPISTILTVAFGSKIPIIFCLAMHQAMYDNVAIKKNIEFLENKISFISPNLIEGKAKIVEPNHVLQHILKKIGRSSPILFKKKVLIVAGPTVEYIDPVRVITNRSSGRTGVFLASELLLAGSNVTLIYGQGKQEPPKGAKIISVETTKEMSDALKKEMSKIKFDVVIMAAAAADYIPKKPSRKKIKSSKSHLTISLKRTSKIIERVKKIQKDVFLVGFKAETSVSELALIREARKKMKQADADLIIANDVGSKKYKQNPHKNKIIIVDSKNAKSIGWRTKEKIAQIIVNEIEKRITNKQK